MQSHRYTSMARLTWIPVFNYVEASRKISDLSTHHMFNPLIKLSLGLSFDFRRMSTGAYPLMPDPNRPGLIINN